MKKLTIPFVFLITISFNSSFSQNFESMDSLANLVIDKFGVRGIAMVGVNNGDIVYSKGFGKANEKYSMGVRTPFYIASNTKAFIAMGILKLSNQGKLDLDDSLTEYIDKAYFNDSLHISNITIRDLISHNTGLSNDPYTFRTSSSGEYPKNQQELLKFSRNRNNKGISEKSFSYSNLGYLLAGQVIENITGKSWKDYLEIEILTDLGLTSTHPYMPSGIERQIMAIPYTFYEDNPLKIVKANNTLHAAGGLFTNLVDMGKWLSFFTSNESLTEVKNSSYKGFDSNLIELEDSFGPINISGYGYGLYHGELSGIPIKFHAGGFSGHNSFISYLPEKHVGFFIFMNENSNLRLAALHLSFLFYHIVTKEDNFEKTFPIFNKRVQSVKDNYEPIILKPIDPKEIDLPVGEFYNEKYGTLRIFDYPDRYEITLGLNLISTVYVGETEKDILVQFIPGNDVHFTIVGEGKDLKIKYDKDFGYFLPVPKN